jgi:glycosyltransferase involved in cell wall biosynthesis
MTTPEPQPFTFSVITPSLNCGAYLADNIASVMQQNLGADQWEHWVVDGGSTDETPGILAAHPHVQWISEPDRGLSDAVNKGLLRAKNDWILWLNADDRLAPQALNRFMHHARRSPDIRMFCGDLVILRYDGSQEQIIKGWNCNYEDLLARRPDINQPAIIVHRSVYQEVGPLDTNNKYAMDYEWMVRATRRFECRYIPEVLAVYRRRKGSIMDVNAANQFRVFRSVRRAHHRRRLEYLEFLTLYYLWTEPLRRLRWVRKAVRRIKGWLGREPLHPG